MRNRITQLAIVLLIIIGCSGIATAGHAQDAPAPAPTSPPTTAPPTNKWSLSPAGDGDQPGTRPYFSYELGPGSTINDAVTLFNDSDNPLTFDVYPRDAFNTPAGGFDVLTAAQNSSEVGTWITIAQPKVPVPAHSGVKIPFTVTVPANASPGDHAGGMVASISSGGEDSSGKKVLVDHRVGSRVYIRVPGTLNPSFVVENIDTSYQGTGNPIGRGDVDVTYTVRNAGNIRLAAHQQIRVTGPLGWTLQERSLDDIPELLPGSTVTRTEHFAGVPPVIRVTGEVTVTPFSSASAKPVPGTDASTRSTTTWAIPWTLLMLLALAFGMWRVVRWQRRRDDGGDGDGDGNGDGDERGDATTGDQPDELIGAAASARTRGEPE